MCGFVVVVDSMSPVDEDVFSKQLESIKQRGPDDFGIHSPGPGVWLGSRRLSVQDVSSNGRMPMCSRDGKVSVVFNGEIYNFRALRNELATAGFQFASSSDTEVLLYSYIHWGKACLTRFDGMFAFVISDYRDTSSPQLFFARDKAGEKPLYWYKKNSRLILSSELSPILIDPDVDNTISIKSLHMYLGLGYIPAPETILINAKKLLPAHYAVVDVTSKTIDIKRYWQLPKFLHEKDTTLISCANTVFDLLKQSVADRMIADVPLGVFLSGGLDSSLVAAAAAQISPSNFKTFTIVFPNGGSYDEREYASIVAKHFGTEHYELPFTSDGLFEEMMLIMDVMDEPMGDSSVLPTSLLSRATRELVTVALGGDGGDELFGGYPSYCSVFGFQPNLLGGYINVISGEVSKRLPLGVKGRDYVASIGTKGGKWFSRKSVIFNARDRSNILSKLSLNDQPFAVPEDFKLHHWDVGINPADAAMRTDFQTYLPNDILTKVDRASMAHSLEVRAPFLSSKLIEFAYSSVPIQYKVSPTRTKIVLKEIASMWLPKELSIERKQGFSVPASFYKSDRWQRLILDSIASLPRDLFDQEFLFGLARKAVNAPSLIAYFFPIIILSAWFRRFRL